MVKRVKWTKLGGRSNCHDVFESKHGCALRVGANGNFTNPISNAVSSSRVKKELIMRALLVDTGKIGNIS